MKEKSQTSLNLNLQSESADLQILNNDYNYINEKYHKKLIKREQE